ncbi:MAG TPA: SPOR domain-containing protein [Novosphingobium sp.]|nr:SPOR domain-containing protein [Novosphingobium sp.]
MRFPVNHSLPLAALILLGAASGSAAADRRQPPPDLPATGPAADYPVVVGEPFTIDGKEWTPVDQLNYDAVGQAVVGEGAGVTGAHKTLPLPCYVEVTALDSGRTILVRLERRGPMTNNALVELSPDAAAQLGISAGGKGAVRLRRVNPPEQERALLRKGGRVPERMETPEGLLKVLRRKLADQSPLMPPVPAPPAMPTGARVSPSPAPVEAARPPIAPPSAKPAPAPSAKPVAKAPAEPASPSRAAATAKGAFVVQVAAFSSESSARKVAGQLGGSVSAAGKFWRVRLGPYTNRAQAAPALEKARRAGYSDARIQSAE